MEFSGNSIEDAVRRALSELIEVEREVIIRYYIMGQKHEAIAEVLRISAESVRYRKRCGVGKLRYILSPFVRRRFGLKAAARQGCILCEDNRLDGIILQYAPYGPWKPVMAAAREMGIESLRSVSTIIHHYKYHLLKQEENVDGKCMRIPGPDRPRSEDLLPAGSGQ
jgi:hypothetical protein